MRPATTASVAAVLAVGALGGGWHASAADWLQPREIQVERMNVAPELVAATRESPIERGKRRPVVDGVGWVIGIPSKIMLWDRRVDNHDVSVETEEAIRHYLHDNGLEHVKLAINLYDPLGDWRRLRANTTVGWGYRYTFGALSVAGEALLPGRLIGGDHYNPFTGTIYLYSDVPAIALQKGGHAKDVARRNHPGTYALLAALPITGLWPEAIATGDALAYAEQHEQTDLEREGYRILYPDYGTHVGGSLKRFVAPVALPVYAGAVVAGHAVGRVQARLVPDADDVPTERHRLADAEAQATSREPVTSAPDGDGSGDGPSRRPVERR